MNPRGFVPVKAKKDLLGAEEKALILTAMRAQVKPAKYWAAIFKRLPQTIERFAREEGIRIK